MGGILLAPLACPREATVRVESAKYPELLVTTPRVQFVDGVAEVDEETAELLRRLPADMGVVVPDVDTGDIEPIETGEDPSKPKRSPRRKAPVKEA